MQFKVPQKIDIEDRILGPLTMIQIVYTAVGAGAGYIILSAISGIVGWIFALPIFLLTFFVVFVKINGQSFGLFLRNLATYMSNPKTRLWRKGDNNIRVEIYHPQITKAADSYANKHYSRADIEKLANIIDSRGKNNPPAVN